MSGTRWRLALWALCTLLLGASHTDPSPDWTGDLDRLDQDLRDQVQDQIHQVHLDQVQVQDQDQDQLAFRQPWGLTRRRRSVLLPSGVKLCSQESFAQALSNHLGYYQLRVCQEAVWEASKVFWARLPERDLFQDWVERCLNGSVGVMEIGSFFSQSQEHRDLIRTIVGEAAAPNSVPVSSGPPPCSSETINAEAGDSGRNNLPGFEAPPPPLPPEASGSSLGGIPVDLSPDPAAGASGGSNEASQSTSPPDPPDPPGPAGPPAPPPALMGADRIPGIPANSEGIGEAEPGRVDQGGVPVLKPTPPACVGGPPLPPEACWGPGGPGSP
ncbi:uncharacterized protein ACNS7B_017026 isoform 2-T2 [Menidia menidia]